MSIVLVQMQCTILLLISQLSFLVITVLGLLFFQTVLDICSLLPKTNIGTLVVSIVTIICLIAAKEINACLSKKIPVPIPVELIAVSMMHLYTSL